MNSRFQDEQYTLSDFQKEVLIHCPRCAKQAIARVDYDLQKATLRCTACAYHKDVCTEAKINGSKANVILPAQAYFKASLWLQAPFREEEVWAYNYAHLTYLERYVAAELREHKDRHSFTLLEKLPRFYHLAKNRTALLQVFKKLKLK